ncbi:MAG TPA: DUF4157 domain-containing protein, partial [Kofleriaceae bacterium]|nr:DUF4157 domain-containing protein [Kofleriaceae bacterium]
MASEAAAPAVPGRLTASQFLPPVTHSPGAAVQRSAAPEAAAASPAASPSGGPVLGMHQHPDAAQGPGKDTAVPDWVDHQLHVVLSAPGSDNELSKAKQRLDMVLSTVRALPGPTRAALLARLEKPDPKDEIARLFQDRLAAASRSRVLAALRDGGGGAEPAGHAEGDHADTAPARPAAAAGDASAAPSAAPAAAPGGVQRKEAGAASAGDVHQAASRGVADGGSALPHAETIQRSFGAHDVSGIQAHTGPAAQQAAGAIGAQAYAMGNHVAFAGAADLHTAAHEAAHVVQQRAGVQLKGGVGEAGDAYERHADAVADQVVAGRSAEGLLSQMAPAAAAPGVQRREVATDAEITGTQDWTTADRVGNTARWQAACLRNLNAVDSSQYVKVVERRDFYHWFYNYTARLGYQTRWALAAEVVANGAHQIADMDDSTVNALANDTFGLASVELQGAMREGNQVIFDNVLPKLKRLLDGGPLRGRQALEWDKQILAEEQTLIQPLYGRMSPQATAQINRIARKQGMVVGGGAWVTGQDKVAPGDNNNGGRVPGFPDGQDLNNPADRWRYGMNLGNQFTPGGTGFNPATDAMPAPGTGYTDGSEFARVDTRHNLHQLDAWLNPNRLTRTGAGSDMQAIISALTPFEKQQVLTDHSPDGWAYSTQFGQFISISEAMVRQALPSDAAAA